MKKTLHNKFLTYLEKNVRMLTEEQRIEVIEVAENNLPEFIRTYFLPTYGELYEQTDYKLYQTLRSRVSSDAAAKSHNRIGHIEYTYVMKFYSEFLQSKLFKGKEVVMLTEKELQDKETKKHKTPSPIKTKEDPMQPAENPELELTEGRIHQVNITKHERNKELRQLCLQHYGYICQVCGMNFEETYGEIGKSFIEVHHINPIADTDGEHVLDPKIGLIPLCSNCHSMIHRGPNGTVLTPEELKTIINNQKKQE
jgi:hypothetical protein